MIIRTMTPIRRMLGVTVVFLSFLPSVHPLGVSPAAAAAAAPHRPLVPHPQQPAVLAGDWKGAKLALRSPDCCVVSVPGLEAHLRVLQEELADNGPADIDLRHRVHVQSSAYKDCFSLRRSVWPLPGDDNDTDNDNDNDEDEQHHRSSNKDPCAAALEELVRGVASLADGPLEGVCEDVFLRIVCASDYQARDPMYHTDKAPLRGYVTLRGVGTEFMTRPSTPLEYMTLRSLGKAGEPGRGSSVRQAQELEFVVMKGDHYQAMTTCDRTTTPYSSTTTPSWWSKVWKRASACVHRSPPGARRGGRRVIISLDLADGDDDREWYQANQKREWRSGMTQRKSRLVA